MRGIRFYGFGINRTICDVLREMRKYTKHMGLTANNDAVFGSLIEEAQIMANRMEAKLYDRGEIKAAIGHRDGLKKEIKELEDKHEQLQPSKQDDDS